MLGRVERFGGKWIRGDGESEARVVDLRGGGFGPDGEAYRGGIRT